MPIGPLCWKMGRSLRLAARLSWCSAMERMPTSWVLISAGRCAYETFYAAANAGCTARSAWADERNEGLSAPAHLFAPFLVAGLARHHPGECHGGQQHRPAGHGGVPDRGGGACSVAGAPYAADLHCALYECHAGRFTLLRAHNVTQCHLPPACPTTHAHLQPP